MFKNLSLILFCFAIAIQSTSLFSQNNQVNNDDTVFIDKLIARMTLEDKVGEMTQFAIDVLLKVDSTKINTKDSILEPQELDPAKLKYVLVDLKVGSILNVAKHAYTRDGWKEIITTIQDIAENQKSSGIPVLYGIDAIHGVNYTMEATLFPQQLALASSWNPEMARKSAGIAAYEMRASGIPWNFAPVMDIGRNPLWPRLWETFGEDVYLSSEMGKAFVMGLQGDDMSSPDKAGACLKHFLGYSQPLNGKDRTQAWIPERQLREYFVPGFQAAIDAGAKSIMVNSGEFNGIPVHANKEILTDLLRGDMGFTGMVVTDWDDITYLYTRHNIARNYKEAIKLAINAGVDMAMVPFDLRFPVLLKELVQEGHVPISRIDESVRRILQFKKDLGLFETPYFPFENYQNFSSEEFKKTAKIGSDESIILLENDGILPLKEDIKVLLTGPTAHNMSALNGGWTGTWQGRDTNYHNREGVTIYEALKEKLGDQLVYLEGTGYDKLKNWQEATEAAKEVDIIVACLGEYSYTEKPGDIDDLDLPAAQLALVKNLKRTGKPIILILTQGRPRVIRDVVFDASAILCAFLPGEQGARSIRDILFGKVNPSAKLPITYPRYSNDLTTYDHKGTDLISRTDTIGGFNPQWEFGYGLSYTKFNYSNLKLDNKAIKQGEMLTISVNVRNTGEMIGKEVVQLYISDQVASITPSVKRLRGFKKIVLQPGESQNIQFTIYPRELAFVGMENKWITEPGMFTVQVGELTAEFELKE